MSVQFLKIMPKTDVRVILEAVLLSYPKGVLGKEDTLHVFICSDLNTTDE